MFPDLRALWEVAKFIVTKSNKTFLLDNSGQYAYKVCSRYGDKTYWACRNKCFQSQKSCLARAITDGMYVTYWKGDHDHSSNVLTSDVRLDDKNMFQEIKK